MLEFTMLIGLPGSGKSTYTRQLLANSKNDTVVISSDDIIEEWGKEIDPSWTYAEAFNHFSNLDKHKSVNAELNKRLYDAIADKKNIIWDQTNLAPKARSRKLNRIPQVYHKTAVVFELPEDELKSRLDKREKETGKTIPDHVVKGMRDSYIEPMTSEGFDKIIHV